MNLAKATRILKTPKEFGENLMILDLIRNDLYELVPDVRVEEFMSVEEYERLSLLAEGAANVKEKVVEVSKRV